MDKKFAVTISLNIEEQNNMGKSPFFNSSVSYSDLPYVGVLAIETMLGEMMQKLLSFGYDIAKDDPEWKKLQVLLGVIKPSK